MQVWRRSKRGYPSPPHGGCLRMLTAAVLQPSWTTACCASASGATAEVSSACQTLGLNFTQPAHPLLQERQRLSAACGMLFLENVPRCRCPHV